MLSNASTASMTGAKASFPSSIAMRSSGVYAKSLAGDSVPCSSSSFRAVSARTLPSQVACLIFHCPMPSQPPLGWGGLGLLKAI